MLWRWRKTWEIQQISDIFHPFQDAIQLGSLNKAGTQMPRPTRAGGGDGRLSFLVGDYCTAFDHLANDGELSLAHSPTSCATMILHRRQQGQRFVRL